jgi:hypothetical protein
VIGQLKAVDFGFGGTLHMLLGQAVQQPNQHPMLLVNQGNAGFEMRVPGKNLKHDAICAIRRKI